MMKLINLKWTVLALLASAALSSGVRGESFEVRNCTWCHGTSGQGLFPAPALAGQRSAYILSQLSDFAKHKRDNPFSRQYMWPATAALSSQAARNLAVYFSKLPPEAANNGNKLLAAAGKKIYENGEPEANIAACIACHGPNAVGVREIPRLGGLDSFYLTRKLEQWGQGYHASSLPMSRIAQKLSQYEIEALASYLSYAN